MERNSNTSGSQYLISYKVGGKFDNITLTSDLPRYVDGSVCIGKLKEEISIIEGSKSITIISIINLSKL